MNDISKKVYCDLTYSSMGMGKHLVCLIHCHKIFSLLLSAKLYVQSCPWQLMSQLLQDNNR